MKGRKKQELHKHRIQLAYHYMKQMLGQGEKTSGPSINYDGPNHLPTLHSQIETFFKLKSNQKLKYNNNNSCTIYTTSSPKSSKREKSSFKLFQKKLDDPGQAHNSEHC